MTSSFWSKKYWAQWLVPALFFHRSRPAIYWLMTSALLLLSVGWVQGLLFAPTDETQGEVYRIIYLHVPCAVTALGCYAAMCILSLQSLIWRLKLADHLHEAITPIGILFTSLAIITGAIWGKPTWGTWWIWDARLTSMLLLLFMTVGIHQCRQMISNHHNQHLAVHILTLIGGCDLPVIHFSVQWWTTLHQGASLLKLGMPSIDHAMLWPLLINMLAMLLLGTTFVLLRAHTLLLQRYGTLLFNRSS